MGVPNRFAAVLLRRETLSPWAATPTCQTGFREADLTAGTASGEVRPEHATQSTESAPR
jgi:hypothetical protein